MTAGEILNNKNYLAISYGGYRHNSREVQPTITEIKEDLKILSSIGYKILRTYNVHFAEAKNLLQAIKEIQNEIERNSAEKNDPNSRSERRDA